MPSFVHPLLVWLAATKLSALMLQSKWWWAFMMDMHFVGLTLLMGTIGLLDLRVLGFVKELPVSGLHKLVPWGIGGFGINVVTGVLAFIGMPLFYGYDAAFWLKMQFIALAGVNVLMFYTTSAFRECEALGPGQDAPRLAKFIAAGSLFLWIGVIFLGRYIQVYQDTINH
jgi:hypothetical protein